MYNKVLFIFASAALFTEVTVKTALFLLFHKHLLSDSGFKLFSLSAVFVQTSGKPGPKFCCKS